MRLIIGGQAQGKLRYALGTAYSPQDIADCQLDEIDRIFEKKIIYQLHELVYKLLLQNIDSTDFIQKGLKPEHIIICNEVGSGVVPIDKFERAYRDAVGEICCFIAEQAETVERICCGIPTKIKG